MPKAAEVCAGAADFPALSLPDSENPLPAFFTPPDAPLIGVPVTELILNVIELACWIPTHYNLRDAARNSSFSPLIGANRLLPVMTTGHYCRVRVSEALTARHNFPVDAAADNLKNQYADIYKKNKRMIRGTDFADKWPVMVNG